MTDWTHSFVRNVSMFPDKYERFNLAPPKEPNTTMLKLDCLPGQSSSLVCTCSEGNDEITDATPEGKALLDFLCLMVKEPGHENIVWGRARELEDCILIFLGN